MNTGIILRRILTHPPITTQMEVKNSTSAMSFFSKIVNFSATSLNAVLETWTIPPDETAGPSRTRCKKRKPLTSTTMTSPTTRGTHFYSLLLHLEIMSERSFNVLW